MAKERKQFWIYPGILLLWDNELSQVTTYTQILHRFHSPTSAENINNKNQPPCPFYCKYHTMNYHKSMNFYVLRNSGKWTHNYYFARWTTQTYHYPGGCKFEGACAKNRGGRSAAPSTRLLIWCIWKKKTNHLK
jgi:hypothetical protein